MEIIFLDVDGVLNTAETRDIFGLDALVSRCVLNFKNILEQTKAQYVLSSNWRLKQRDQNILKSCFEKHDIPLWIDVTPVLNNRSFANRKNEITEWILGKDISRVAIIDDYPVKLTIPTVNIRLFQTTDELGLTDDIAKQVIQFLNG